MNPEKIKASLRIKGCSCAQIARRLDVSPNLVSLVIHGRGKSMRVAKEISSATGIPLETLWPSYRKAA